LLVPVNWEEPFGLVMIEAMACGTPVVAYRRGSVPEVIDEGVTGLIVHTVDQAVKAIVRISRLSRKRCRRIFEERFTASRMATDYVAIYERLIEDRAGEKTLSRGRPFWTTTSSAWETPYYRHSACGCGAAILAGRAEADRHGRGDGACQG